MPISGLVVTLKPDTARRAVEQIRHRPEIQLGERQGQRLPVVVDTPDPEADKACWRWLNALEGVHHVDVAFVHFEEADAPSAFCSAITDQPLTQPTIGET